MKSRLATTINAAIALVTIIVLVVDLRVRHGKVSADSKMTQSIRADQGRLGRRRYLSASDISQMRVDKLGEVPPSELLDVLLQATPDEIVTLALKFNQLPNNSQTFSAVGIFFQAWAQIDGRTALKTAFQMRSLIMRRSAAHCVVYSVSPSDCPDLAKYIRDNPNPELLQECRGDYLGTLIQGWSHIDAQEASDFYDNLTDEERRPLVPIAREISFAWATVDPKAAIAWVDKQEARDRDNQSNQEPGNLIDYAIQGWYARDAATAATYLAAHANRSDASTAISAVTLLMFDENPEKAAKWLGTISSSDAKLNAENTLAAQWSHKDLSAAVGWFGNLPAAEQKIIVEPIARTWAAKDINEASKWFEGLQGDLHDIAIQSAIGADPNSSPQDSLSLAVSIQDVELRTNLVEGVVQQWMANQPDAARAWIATSSLANEEKQKLLFPKNDSEPSFDH